MPLFQGDTCASLEHKEFGKTTCNESPVNISRLGKFKSTRYSAYSSDMGIFELKSAMRNFQDVSRRLARCLETSCKRRLETSFCETSRETFRVIFLRDMKNIIFDPVSSQKVTQRKCSE